MLRIFSGFSKQNCIASNKTGQLQDYSIADLKLTTNIMPYARCILYWPQLIFYMCMLLIKYCKFYFICFLFLKVGGIVDEYFWNKKQNFTVEVQQLPEEEWDITGALIEEISGISIQRSGCTVTGSVPPDASSALPALYVALFAIDLLSQKSV